MKLQKIRVVPGDGISTSGTEVYVDGQRLAGVARLAIEARVGDVWHVELEQHLLVTEFEVETTDLSVDVRTYRAVSRWTLLKALFSPRRQHPGGDIEKRQD